MALTSGSKKGILLTLLTIVLLVLMVGELTAYVVLDANYSQLAMQAAFSSGAGELRSSVNLGMSSYLQTALQQSTGIIAASSNAASANYITLKEIMENGTIFGSPTNMSGSTVSKYIASLQDYASSRHFNISLSNSSLSVYRYCAGSVIAVYTAEASVQSPNGDYSFGVNATASESSGALPANFIVPYRLVASGQNATC